MTSFDQKKKAVASSAPHATCAFAHVTRSYDLSDVICDAESEYAYHRVTSLTRQHQKHAPNPAIFRKVEMVTHNDVILSF